MSRTGNTPELILLAGRVHTFCARSRTVRGVAVASGRVAAIGSLRALLRMRARRTRVLDLGPATLTPGLVDCHTHFFYWALARELVIDVSRCASLNEVLDDIRRQAAAKRVGLWVVARGFDYNRWSSTPPCAADLDRAVAGRPALVRSRDGHTAWLNTAGLRVAGIVPETPDPPGGRYLRDAHGQPTGIAQEAAVERLPDPVRDLALRTDAQAHQIIDRALDTAYRTAWSLGIVGVHSMDDGPSLSHLQRHHAAGRLGLRVLHAVQLADLDRALRVGLRSGLGDDWLGLGGIKIFADGALGSQTAYMLRPYPGRGHFCGVPVIAGQELREAVRKAAQHGWAVWIHAIGDRAVHEAVAAIAAAGRPHGAALPHRVEHAQCVRPADIRRMARAGIVASVQPCHLLGDIPIADRHWPHARRYAYPLREMLEAGVTLAAGSDVPVEALDPRRSLFAATMRTDEQGTPPGGWFPAQRLTAEQALRAFTVGAARAAGKAPPAGTLAPGAPADLTIWGEDPLDAVPSELLRIPIHGCVVGGNVHLAAG